MATKKDRKNAAGAIERFHADIGAVIASNTENEVAFVPEHDLVRLEVSSKFMYEAIIRNEPFYVNRNGEKCPVLPMYKKHKTSLESSLWISWHETWRKTRDTLEAFNILGVSLTFYWGIPDYDPIQFLRAEWDWVDDPCKGVKNKHAQPHWQIDRDAYLSFVPRVRPDADSSGRKTDLDELEVEPWPIAGQGALQDLGISDVHLAMGGWHHAAEHPDCWQRALNIGELPEWLDRTLAYTKAQFERLKPGELVM